MTVAEAIYARLVSLTAVTDLVSMRVRVLTFKQSETFPAIRVQEVSEVEGMQLRGSTGQLMSRVQVDIYAEALAGVDAYALARNIDAAVHGDGAGSALAGFSGDIGSPAFRIHGIFPAGRQEMYEVAERRFVRVLREYEVHYRA